MLWQLICVGLPHGPFPGLYNLCSLVFVGYMISPAGLEIWYFAIVVILINTFIILFGTDSFRLLLPIVVFLCLFGHVLNTYQINKRLWRHGMLAKGKAL